MSEYSLVEQPVIEWLTGKPNTTPPDAGLGWTYRDEAAMQQYDRPLTDPLVEQLLIEALIRINADVQTPAQAQLAIAPLRQFIQNPDRLTANQKALDLLINGVAVQRAPGQPTSTVQFFAYEADRQHLNDFTATNQYKVQGVKRCREDTVG